MHLHLTPEQVARFWSRVQTSDGCWLWQGATNEDGYGIVGFDGRCFLAHRVAVFLSGGDLSNGACALHQCDVHYAPGDWTYRRCCRPEHIRPGTRVENNAEAKARGRLRGASFPGDLNPSRRHPERLQRGTARWCAKLDDEAVRLIRRLSAAGLSSSQIAPHVGVNRRTVSRVLRGEIWAHVA